MWQQDHGPVVTACLSIEDGTSVDFDPPMSDRAISIESVLHANLSSSSNSNNLMAPHGSSMAPRNGR
jgi:hypothetical protein